MTVPLREQLTNNASTTLNGSIISSDTSITATTGSVFPSTGNFRLKIEDEIIVCTARSGNTLTVTRGAEGTTAASHSSGASIAHILTAAGFARWAQNSNALWAPASQPPFGIFDTDGKTLLTASDFTWVNQGTSTVTDHNRTIILDVPPASGENCRILYRAAPSPSYTVIAAFDVCGILESGSYASFGLMARQSTTGKFYACVYGGNNGVLPFQHAIYKFTNATTFSGSNLTNRAFTLVRPTRFWMKMNDNNTNVTFSVSMDGVNWIQTGQEARGTFLSASGGVTGPDQLGFLYNNYGSSLYHALVRLVHWSYV
jgi:hypothetical protein